MCIGAACAGLFVSWAREFIAIDRCLDEGGRYEALWQTCSKTGAENPRTDFSVYTGPVYSGVLDGTDATTHADFGLGGNASLVAKEVTIRFFDVPTYTNGVGLDLSAFNSDDKIELDMAQLYANYYDTAPLVGGGALARGVFTEGHNNPAYRSTTTNAAKVVGAEDGGIWAAGAYTGGLLALDVGGAANAINNAALATRITTRHTVA